MYTPNDDGAFEDNLEGFLSDALNVVKKAAGIAVSLVPGGSVSASVGGKLISAIPSKKPTAKAPDKKAIFSSAFRKQPSYPKKLTKTSTASVSSTKISLDPSINASLKEINNRLKRAEIQREATSEHNSIVKQDSFERNVIKKLSLIDAAAKRIPIGVRRDRVIRLIIRA